MLALPGDKLTGDMINDHTLSMCKDSIRIVNVRHRSLCQQSLDVFKNMSTNNIKRDLLLKMTCHTFTTCRKYCF